MVEILSKSPGSPKAVKSLERRRLILSLIWEADFSSVAKIFGFIVTGIWNLLSPSTLGEWFSSRALLLLQPLWPQSRYCSALRTGVALRLCRSYAAGIQFRLSVWCLQLAPETFIRGWRPNRHLSWNNHMNASLILREGSSLDAMSFTMTRWMSLGRTWGWLALITKLLN